LPLLRIYGRSTANRSEIGNIMVDPLPRPTAPPSTIGTSAPQTTAPGSTSSPSTGIADPALTREILNTALTSLNRL
jgi:hypothetical protein